MNNEENKKKILATITVAILFLAAGGLFFLISLDNKQKTEILKRKVEQINLKKRIQEDFAKINLATSTPPEVKASSYLTMIITDDGLKKILQQKNPDKALPIASITKLMTAIIILENIDLNTKIKATTDYIGLEESTFILETDKTYTVKELLANMLISSDNDSARLLSSIFGTENFINKMNRRAPELGLANTSFTNVTGLDPKKPEIKANISSANDLALLLIYFKKNYPEVLRMTANPEYNFCDINNYCKIINNTNKLLENSNLKFKVIGSKTGSTDLSGKNLVLLTEITENIFLINIILNSTDHFKETQLLISNIIKN